MALVVQKYGGSSVADLAAMRRVAARVIERHNAGDTVVVVVPPWATLQMNCWIWPGN